MRTHIDRVAVISDDLEGDGGASAIAVASVRQMQRLGIPVAMLAGGGAPPLVPRQSDEVVALGGQHLLAGGRARAAVRGLHDGGVRSRLADWITANDTPGTIYHLHNWHKVLSPACFAPLRQVADRLVVSAHDFFLSCPNGGFFDFRRRAVCEFNPLSAGCLLSNCDKRHFGHKAWRVTRHLAREALFDFRRQPATVLAVHEGMAPLLGRRGIAAGAIRVLRNPVTAWQGQRIEAERNRALLYVGRLELDKGIDTLALAARRLGVRLRIVGDGPLAGVLPELCPGVEMLGRQPSEAIGAIAGSARLVVLPTRVRETFGLVALEAAMSGLPVVSSTSALISDELVALGMGRSCGPDDPDALAGCLADLLDDDAAVAAMSRRGFAAARRLAPTEEQWGERLAGIYAQILARSADSAARRPATDKPVQAARMADV
ncbi:MAG TPA: glycosyltransferase family 4 protein [Amaricoccus sp.]|uniref:glycosyltransferase family 4 protein n=1 Tax=Amaricoccus sp. TaxID=1872485 RepID=UPI002BAA4678|nr:glycosyltransferase family 4 protein [Amaricoccus sp.]HMQ92241.1 glycosyltransferase family 4 protein [Amaricoccus sp.]HMR51646.1 glycosyltransferase family 4 protein [Amaricoccus sp.]HMR59074.1 glycosyltransferase family 4 protein [Amaricoccus sp.]HMT98418.1 glycosyltransferase family 4 protein [Amaricoccus sp.]